MTKNFLLPIEMNNDKKIVNLKTPKNSTTKKMLLTGDSGLLGRNILEH